MTSHYYHILGISSTASLAEIKSAYRRKAKVLHPDRNPDPRAHEQFLELSEAYDYLVGLKTGKYTRSSRKGKKYSSQNRKEEEARQRAQSRARAQEHAHMKFEAYKKTEHYKDSLALVVATRFATLLVSVFLLIGLPLLAWSVNSSTLWTVTGIIMVFSMPVWLDVVRNPMKYLDFSDLGEAMGRVAQFEGFQTVGSLTINGILFFGICLSTMIPLVSQILFMILAASIAYMLIPLTSFRKFRSAISLGLIPFLFTGAALLNYLTADSPVQETYSYSVIQHHRGNGHYEHDLLITLEGNAYENYQGIRFILSTEDEDFKRQGAITYTFREGCFGWRVMSDYELH